MALSHVIFVGLKAVVCKNLINSGMLCVVYALLHCYVLVGVGLIGGEFIGMRHNPVLVSLGPSRMCLLLYLTITFALLNSAMQPASHSLPMEINEL
jgi:hypothetical protein